MVLNRNTKSPSSISSLVSGSNKIIYEKNYLIKDLVGKVKGQEMGFK